MSTTTNNVVLNISTKKDYTINGDKTKIIKLNPNDMHILSRLEEVIPKLNSMEEKYSNLFTTDTEQTEDKFQEFTSRFKELDTEMREIVNYLFDYDICGVCADGGSMFDLQDGEYRYVVIVNTLLTLYEDTITAETNKMLNKMKKKVEKYTNRDHKRKGSK